MADDQTQAAFRADIATYFDAEAAIAAARDEARRVTAAKKRANDDKRAANGRIVQGMLIAKMSRIAYQGRTLYLQEKRPSTKAPRRKPVTDEEALEILEEAVKDTAAAQDILERLYPMQAPKDVDGGHRLVIRKDKAKK